MLKVFCGSDQLKVRGQAHAYVDSVLKDGQEVVRLEADEYESGMLASVSGTVSLFSTSDVYVLDTPSLNKDFLVEFMDQLEALATSDNIFVVMEGDIRAPEKKKIAKHTDEIKEFKAEKSEQGFNMFKITEALALKDKRSLWVLWCESKQNGASAEEAVGILWWQLKIIRLAGLTNSAEEAGVKDYPYRKAKQALRNFKPGELEKLSLSLIALYHDAHKGKRDIDIALEKWILTM